jgi:hypothetical protein
VVARAEGEEPAAAEISFVVRATGERDCSAAA